MLLKSFKRTISIALALIFVLSFVPFVGMAEEQTVDIPMTSIVNTRGSKAAQGNQTAFANTLRVQSGTGNADWHVYAQFDLSGYEEILANESTNVTFEISVGGQTSGSLIQRDFKVYLMSDSCDYRAGDITYNDAAKLGLHNPEDNGQVIAEEEEDGAVSYLGTYSTAVSAQTILGVLKQGKTNSVITVVFTTTEDSNPSCFVRDSGKLKITYDDALVDNKAYTEEIANEINWSDLSDEAQNSVTQNLSLPTKLYGADISWSSSDDGVINSSGEVTQGFEKKTVTLNASVSYNDEITTKSFLVTVDKMIYNYTDIYDGNASFFTVSGANSSYIKIDSGVPGLGGKSADDVVYNVHDLSGDDKYINYFTGADVLDPNKKMM